MGISLAKAIFAWHDLVVVASCDQQRLLLHGATLLMSYHDVAQKVFDQHICCNGSRRQTSFIAGAMAPHCKVRDRDWRNQFNCERFGAFTIVKGRGPVTYCGEWAGHCLARHTWP
jgi:hypothetical protein